MPEPDEAAVQRLVARAAARDERDLAGARGVGADDDLRLGVVAQDVAVRGREAGERLLDDCSRVVEQLAHGGGGVGGHVGSSHLRPRRRRAAVSGVGDGVVDRPRDAARLGEEVVDDGGQAGADEAGQDVDRDQLGPVRGAAADRRDQLGAEGARRVQRGAGDRADDHDDRDHDAADDEAGEVARASASRRSRGSRTSA